MDLVLSIFPGIDLLGRGFELEGFCVVRGPDPIFGGDVRAFHVSPGRFAGVIGGPPCQDFSRKRRAPATGNGVAMLAEFVRIVTEARPDWWLMENVPGVPEVSVDGFRVQRFHLNAREVGIRQNRLRVFQFGFRDGSMLVVRRRDTLAAVEPCCMATEGQKVGRRAFPDFCELQGLPRNFDLPGWSVAAKYRAVGNGVPVPMARVVAASIRRRGDTAGVTVCGCECGRPVTGRQTFATAACRKRMQRKRDAAGVTGPGPDTPAESRETVSHRSPATPGRSRGDAAPFLATWSVTLFTALLLVGCRAPGTRPPPPLPTRAAAMAAPSRATSAALVEPSPLRLVHPVPSLRWRGWNPAVGASITTTNTGLFGIDWRAPSPGRRWLLQSSPDLLTWSDGIEVGDGWQGLFPFRSTNLFFKVTPQ